GPGPAQQEVGLAGQGGCGEQGRGFREAGAGEFAAQGGPGVEAGVVVGEGGGDLQEVVDDEAVHQPFPAGLPGHRGRCLRVLGGARAGQQFDALRVPEQGLRRTAVGVHGDQGVLQVRLQDDAVPGVGGERRGDHPGQVRLPPGGGVGRGGERVAVEALGEGGGEVGGGAGQQVAAQPVAHHDGEFLVGEGGGAVPAVAEPGRRSVEGGEGGAGGGVGPLPPAQVVAPQPADVVGDAHVQAELQEQVVPGCVQGADGGRRPGVEGGGAEPEQPAVGEGGGEPPGGQVELPGVGGQQAVAGGRGAEEVEGGGVAVVDDGVLAQAEQRQWEAGVGLGRVGQPGRGGAAAAGLGRGVVGVAGDEGLLGAQVGVLGRGGAGAGGEEGGHDVPAVGHLAGQFVVGDAGGAAQFLGGELDQFGVTDALPAARGAHLWGGGPPGAAHAQETPQAGQPVDAVPAGVRDRPGHLAQQAVQQRDGRVRVGAPCEGSAVCRVVVCGQGKEVHAFHCFPTVCPGGDDQYVCRCPPVRAVPVVPRGAARAPFPLRGGRNRRGTGRGAAGALGALRGRPPGCPRGRADPAVARSGP